MECHEARLLIDEHVHGVLADESVAELNKHLQHCADCREDLRQLVKLRELLNIAKTDAPPEGALAAIWQAVQKIISSKNRIQKGDKSMTTIAKSVSHPDASAGASLWSRWRTTVAITVSIAAILFIAFTMGLNQFGRKNNDNVWTALSSPQKASAVKATSQEASDVVIPVQTLDKATSGDRWETLNPNRPDSHSAFGKPQGGGGNVEPDGGGGMGGCSLDNLIDVGGKAGPGSGGGWGGGHATDANEEKSIRDRGNFGARSGGGRELMEKKRAVVESATATVSANNDGLRRAEPLMDASSAPPPAPVLSSNAVERGIYDKDADSKIVVEKSAENREYARKKAPGAKLQQDKGNVNKEGTGADARQNLTQPKIIKTGELTIEIKNYVEASRAVDALVVKYQGFIADSRTYDLAGATKRGEIVIRIAPEKFEELFAELKKVGAVLQERAGGQDITAQYTDSEARIKNLQVAEERLQDLIKSKTFMDKIQSLLEVERELSRVRGEIEALQGQMRVWQNQLSLSTIRLTLQEPSRAVPSGSLSVEVLSLTEAKQMLDAAITNASGQLLSGQTNKRGDGTLMGNYTLRVKFGRFAELVSAIKALGRAQDERIQNQPFGASIPDGAQDVPCDLMLVLFERSIQMPNGVLHLEVISLPEALSKLDVTLAAAQATIINNQTQQQDDGSTQAQISLRARAGNFAALMKVLPMLGRVTHSSANGEVGKILGGAADVPTIVSLQLFEQRKQIPSGNLNLEVVSLSEAMSKLDAILATTQATIINNQTQRQSDGSSQAQISLRSRAGNFATLVDALPALGRVTQRNINGEAGKILGGAADVPATLSLQLIEQRKQVPSGHLTIEVAAFAEARDKLAALIKEHGLQMLGSDSQQRGDGSWSGMFRLGIKAGKLDLIVSQLEKYGHVKARQIQGLGSDLSKVDPNVIGEIVIALAEKPTLTPQEEGSFRLMLRETFGGFLSSMSFVIRGLGLLLPWLILAVLIIWLASRFSRRIISSQVTRDNSNQSAPPTSVTTASQTKTDEGKR